MIIIFLTLLICAGCAINPVTKKPEFRLFSDKDEIQLGLEVKNKLIKQYGVYESKELQRYIEEVGYKLVKVSERAHLPYSFTILNTDMINAFAAPGGQIFVTVGILKEFQDEAELAFVLGHEIGHVSARHGMKALEKRFGYQVGLIIASILLRYDVTKLAKYTDFLASMVLLGYGRKNEFQADECGLRYGILCGYDPYAMIDFFKRLEKLEGKPPTQLETLFRSHPPTRDRIKECQKYISKLAEVPKERGQERYKSIIKTTLP